MTKTEVKLLDGRGGRAGRPFVEVARVFDTGRERVWQALTAKDEFSAWYPTRMSVDLRIGAKVTFRFPGGGDDFRGDVLSVKHCSELVIRPWATI